MEKINAFFIWLFIDPKQPELALAQFNELKTKVLFFYALVILYAFSLSYTHFDFAPLYLTVGLPVPIISLTIARIFLIWRDRKKIVTPALAVTKLRKVLVFCTIFAIIYTAWAISIVQYGETSERGYVALFRVITIIGCLVCLVHLPQAVIIILSIVPLPYIIYFFGENGEAPIAIIVSVLLMGAVLVRVLFSVYIGFKLSFESKLELEKKNRETEQLNEINETLSLIDKLTGLSNRRHFFKQLDTKTSKGSETDCIFAIGIIDLDHFKTVNDTYGHKYGDQLLNKVAERLESLKFENISMYRLGGDEFGFIFDGNKHQAERIGNLICQKMKIPFLIDGICVNIEASCGIAMYPEAAHNGHDLFDKADYALYSSKSNTKGTTTIFSEQHEYLIETQRGLETALKSSDFSREFQVFLQPILAAHERNVIGFEALARWESPKLGSVPPDRFIDMAERLGLINKLTQCLFEKALDHLKQLPKGMYLSFNLSAHDITSPETVDKLLEIIVEKKVDPTLLVFEITENSVVDNFKTAEYCINRLKNAGAAVALDDFGIGYSSLGYLHKLNFDIVKIDRSFVTKLKAGSDTRVILSILNLCRSLSINCIVEGVETMEQLLLLESMQCRLVQGYYFSPPMPIEKIEPFLKENEALCLQNNSAQSRKDRGKQSKAQLKYSFQNERIFKGELING